MITQKIFKIHIKVNEKGIKMLHTQKFQWPLFAEMEKQIIKLYGIARGCEKPK